MASTTFVDKLTVINTPWLNDVNNLVWGVFSGATSAASARIALGVSQTGTDTTYAFRANNGSDFASPSTVRTNIGAAASGANTDITSLASPALSSATATTQAPADNTTKVATTAFVTAVTQGAASQAQQEAATSTTVYTSPGTQQYHPGMPKAWLRMTCVAGVPSIIASYNISGLVRNSAGNFTVTFTKAFSSGTSYGLSGISQLTFPNVSANRMVVANSFGTGATCTFETQNAAATPDDNNAYTFVQWFGDQ